MFDIGFSELLLVFIIGLIVLGPQRLPVAVKTVVGWIRALRTLATNVQSELAQELKLQELQESLSKFEQASKNSVSPELKASVDKLKKMAESMKHSYVDESEKFFDKNPVIIDAAKKRKEALHQAVTFAEAGKQSNALPPSSDETVSAVSSKIDVKINPEESATDITPHGNSSNKR